MEKETKKAAPTLTKVEWQHDGRALVTVAGFAPLTFDPRKASLENRTYAAQFGWDNRIKNKTSVSADKATGKVDQAEKYRLAKEIIEFYESGATAWEMKAVRQTGPDVGLLVRALIALGLAQDVDSANEAIALVQGDGERDAAIAKLWAAGDIAKKVRELRDEGKTFTGNATDMLAELRKGKAA